MLRPGRHHRLLPSRRQPSAAAGAAPAVDGPRGRLRPAAGAPRLRAAAQPARSAGRDPALRAAAQAARGPAGPHRLDDAPGDPRPGLDQPPGRRRARRRAHRDLRGAAHARRGGRRRPDRRPAAGRPAGPGVRPLEQRQDDLRQAAGPDAARPGAAAALLSLDDFFVDRLETPRDAAGAFDYETIDALRLDLLDETLAGLLAGREMRLPRYDFHTGSSTWREEPASLPPGSPLIIEGIHALNARLAAAVPRRNTLRIYVSALTPTNIDDLTYMPTHLPRLFRRLVRDAQFRGYPAATTLQRWNSVREGEKKYIFPWQSNADLFFNTGLPYELGVLKLWAEPRLAAVPPEDAAFGRARGLLEFLGLHLPIDARLVPPTSLLREFIGESGFRY
ncbi:MAG: nucleoside kinase [bacterium]|nr:nucleoside kinase [bacterium]